MSSSEVGPTGEVIVVAVGTTVADRPTGWPEAVAHLRLPQNVASRFAALQKLLHSMSIACSSL
jgi:hypothetical protein